MEQNTPKKLSEYSESWSKVSEGPEGLLAGHEEEIEKIHRILKQSQRVLLAVHEHPDGDALGSALALMHALSLQGKKVTLFAPDEAPETYSFLPGFEAISYEKPNVDNFDTVVLLDSTYAARTHLAEEIKRHPQTINIDHHQDNKREAKINLTIPEAAATAHIMAHFFARTETPVTRDMATCLLTGIFTDTGSFMHDSTTPEILKLAAVLMRMGARLSHIAHETYQKKELSGLRIWGRALSRAISNKKTGAAVSIITEQDLKDCKANLEDLSGVVNMLNTLPETKFALLLCEYEPGKIKGSLRSEPHKGVDVSEIAKRLGGGGHRLAAGFEISGSFVQKDGKWRIVAASN